MKARADKENIFFKRNTGNRYRDCSTKRVQKNRLNETILATAPADARDTFQQVCFSPTLRPTFASSIARQCVPYCQTFSRTIRKNLLQIYGGVRSYHTNVAARMNLLRRFSPFFSTYDTSAVLFLLESPML